MGCNNNDGTIRLRMKDELDKNGGEVDNSRLRSDTSGVRRPMPRSPNNLVLREARRPSSCLHPPFLAYTINDIHPIREACSLRLKLRRTTQETLNAWSFVSWILRELPSLPNEADQESASDRIYEVNGLFPRGGLQKRLC
jgi:hypothetical protein